MLPCLAGSYWVRRAAKVKDSPFLSFLLLFGGEGGRRGTADRILKGGRGTAEE